MSPDAPPPPESAQPRPPAARRRRRRPGRKAEARADAVRRAQARIAARQPAGPPPPEVQTPPPLPPPPASPKRDRPKGQTPKLTPEVHKAIVDAIAATDLPFDDACLLANVHPRTGHEWLERGNGTHKRRPTAPRYAHFAQAVAQARARHFASGLALMMQSARGGYVVATETITRPDGTSITRERRQPPDWRAAESIMERRRPEDFSRKMKIEHEGAAPLVDWAGMVEEAWARIRADAAKRVGQGATAKALPAAAANDSRENGGPPAP